MERFVVVEQVIRESHPYLAKDKLLYKILDRKTGHVSMNAYVKREAADEVAKRKNS